MKAVIKIMLWISWLDIIVVPQMGWFCGPQVSPNSTFWWFTESVTWYPVIHRGHETISPRRQQHYRRPIQRLAWKHLIYLALWERGNLDVILQTTFSNAFSWTKMCEFRLKFQWSFFLSAQLTIFQHCFRQWLGADQATRHHLNHW